MELLIFSPHSQVDLITNSSSELFVFTSDPSMNIYELVHQASMDAGYPHWSFSSMFKEPMTAQKSWDAILNECPIKRPLLPKELEGYPWYDTRLMEWKMESGYYDVEEEFYAWVREHYPEYSELLGYDDIYDMSVISEGDILLYSESENSIPWDVVESLEYFAKERKHLG